MKSAIILFLFLTFLSAGCAPRRIDQAPEGDRIVSLAPNLTEIVCAVGAGSALVGRTSVCDYPPEIIKAVPVIGGFGAPSLDRLLKTKPTLILDVALEDETVADLLKQLGARRVRIPCTTLDEIPTAVLTVGRLAHRESDAQPLAERIRREVAARRTALKAQKTAGKIAPTVFVEIWGDPLMTVGHNSFVSELIALAGGKNLGDEVTDKDYFPVSSEWVIAHNPDIILCLYMAESAGLTTGHRQQTTKTLPSKIENRKSQIHIELTGRMGWDQIKAVREGRVYGGFDNNLILRPGPRVLEGIDALQACIQQPESRSMNP